MALISRLLDLLKASGWQLAMLAAAASTFLLLNRFGTIPKLDDNWALGAWALLLVCGFLACAPIIASVQTMLVKRSGESRAIKVKQDAFSAAKQKFRDYLPYMTDREQAIFGYLLKHRQKHFTADMDAGYGAGLMAMGFIQRIGVAGQAFDMDKVPMGVPDHVWQVMEEKPELFEYAHSHAERGSKVEIQPWRIPWGAR